MKKYAAKRQDGSVYTIQCKHSPENFLEDLDNDTLMNEITDANPLPSKAFRDSWQDNGSGDIEIDLTGAKTEKKASCRAERNAKLKTWDDKELEINSKISRKTRLVEDTTAEEADRDAVEDYKQDLRDLGATIDSEVDAELTTDDVEAYEPTWPTEPTL